MCKCKCYVHINHTKKWTSIKLFEPTYPPPCSPQALVIFTDLRLSYISIGLGKVLVHNTFYFYYFIERNRNVFNFFFKKDFFVPRTWSGCYDQISEFFLLRKFHVVRVYIYLPGVVIWQHIHPSTLHSFWEEGWQDSSCLRFFLGLRIIGILLIYWNEARVTYRQETSHSFLRIIC